MQAVEEPEHLQGRRAVEVAGRLVGQHDGGLVGERPGNRDPLTLAPRQRRGQEPGPVGQPDPVQQLGGPPPGRPRRPPGQQRRQLDVLHRGQLVHQVEGLEHEPDSLAPQPGQRPLGQLVHPLAGQPDLPASGPV